MQRRDFLIGSGALVASVPFFPAVAATPRLTVLFDDRYTDASRFAAATGAPTLPTRLDIARLWYGGRLGDTRLAGLTTHADFVVARGCAAEAGRRVIFQASHHRGDAIIHRATVPTLQSVLADGGTDWPEILAEWLTGTPALARSSPPDRPGTLVSWMIA